MSSPVADAVFPYTILAPRSVVPELVPATTGGGRAITAVEQIISYDAGYWGINLTEIPYASRAHKLAWRKLAALLDGRAGTCLVPIFDEGPQDTPPWPIVAGQPVKAIPSVIYPNGTMGPGASIEVGLTEDAALGSVSLAMSVARGGTLEAGMMFSLGVRLYRIKQILSSTSGGPLTTDDGTPLTTDDGTPLYQNYGYTMKIVPPLREAALSGDPVNFAWPVCLCRLKTDKEMLTGADDYAGRTVAAISWEECINP